MLRTRSCLKEGCPADYSLLGCYADSHGERLMPKGYTHVGLQHAVSAEVRQLVHRHVCPREKIQPRLVSFVLQLEARNYLLLMCLYLHLQTRPSLSCSVKTSMLCRGTAVPIFTSCTFPVFVIAWVSPPDCLRRFTRSVLLLCLRQRGKHPLRHAVCVGGEQYFVKLSFKTILLVRVF